MSQGADEMTFATLLLCVMTFLAVFFMYAMEDAEGAATESIYNETNVYWNDFSGNQKFTHTKDDYIVTAFCNDDNDVMIAYREPGESWNYAEVCAFDFAGATAWKLGGIINTDNNSLVLMAGAYVSSYYRVYYFTKFAGSDWDDWDPLLFLYQSGVSFYIGDHAINDTGIILGMCRKSSGNVWTYRLFDFGAYTLSHTNMGVAWEVGAATSAGFQIEANHTGKFWISWKDADNFYKVMDFEKDLAEVKWHLNSAMWLQTMAFLDNGVLVGTGNCRSGISDRPYYYYQEVPGDPMTPIQLDPVASRTWNYAIQIVVTQGSAVPVIIAYSETDEKLYTWGANWDADEATWQGSRHDTGISSDDEYQPLGASNSLWPSHVTTGINWTRLKSGWAIIAEDDDPNPDSFMLISDGVSWTVDLTTADPNITTLTLPNAYYGVFYAHALTKEGGTNPWLWSLLLKPTWMSIGVTNGTIYGMPDSVGSPIVKVRLADAVPRYDEEQWTLLVKASAGDGDGDGVGEPTSFVIDEMGEMWMLLAVTAVFVGLARTYKMAIWRRNQR